LNGWTYHIATRRNYHVWLSTLIVAGPVPDAKTLGAMLDSSGHIEELQMILLVCYNDIDIVRALEAVIHRRQQAISIGRQIYSDDLRRLIAEDIEETRILMREAVMILTPDGGGQENVERRDCNAPLNLRAFLEPFAVLSNHAVNDVDERLVARYFG
jgi:hypothetical protein